ncbi:hypothetical protein CRUP_006189 [Coryphaenoides rupestris]|nr:hypothetical protein CRUP_006189 [Coryphaenoides rupestris]
MLCGPEGITFSFFWKNHEAQSRFAITSGGKVISNGFSVYANSFGGYVEFYTRGNNQRWKVDINITGPFWTHVLFTWTLTDGLMVYINGTFSKKDSTGIVSDNYGDPYPNLVIGTGNDNTYGHYITGAFDEFIIWERALSPGDILLYYNAATGEQPPDSPTTVDVPIRSFLEALPGNLPNKTIPQDSANNLTQQHSSAVVNGLIDTVDRVMEHMVTNLQPSHQSLVSFGGTSFVADYSLMKLPQNYILPHYRFPTQGHSYISVPGEAFTMQCE